MENEYIAFVVASPNEPEQFFYQYYRRLRNSYFELSNQKLLTDYISLK